MSISLHLVATGGTIDKRYNPLTGNLDVGEPVLPAILGLAGLSGEAITVHAVLQKDSLDMNDADRALLADTMGLSAACIAARAPAKTVVLTGAMVPYSVDGSDAAFNVGVAYAAVQQLPAGVYIAMHGRVLPHTHYEKDRAAGCFKPR